MAKTRVYELARNLNLTNKALLEKLSELEIEVKNHMSSLDEETVARVKTALFGKSRPETLEEVRVNPTVIRRRRRKVVEPPEAPQEEVQAPAEAPPAEEAAAEPVSTEKEAVAAEAGKAATTPPADEKEAAPEKAAGAEQPAPAGEEAKPKKVVRKKREPSAKIIQLPVSPPEPEPRKRAAAKPAPAGVQPTPARRPSVVPAPPAPGVVRETRKKKKKRGEEAVEADKKFLKKKISFRKKAVVEGHDLYDDTFRARKPRKGAKAKRAATVQKTPITTAKAIKRRIKIDEAIVLSDLAKRMGVKAGEIIKALMSMGVMATVNQAIDFETAALVAAEFDYEVEKAAFEEEALLKIEKEEPAKLVSRPPVVTIMGHVDHGKTSLLDVIRATRVTETEAGGITQHIGAYSVATDRGRIAFLDTPAHEAFTAMRARGAQITDIVVLVVAADDGVMPQTVEAINHARAAKVPIIVAVNKIDKANADPERVRRELSEQGLTPEDWGGDTIFVDVSAKQKVGIEDLLEMILLQAEILELKANPEKRASGHVVEARIDPGRGPVATVLVRDGTLHTGDAVVCGLHYGRIRAMLNDLGAPVESAGPSQPVEILGLSGVPMAGDEMVALEDEKAAKQISLHRQQKQRTRELAATSKLSLEKLYERMEQGELKELNLILKADVHGSIEALTEALTKLSNEEVQVNIVHAATGTITESDISLAAVSHAIIIGFNVRPTPKVQAAAAEENVDMRFYQVIYDVIKDVKDAMTGMMESKFEERILGRAEVREVFHIPRVGAVAGCYVTDGKIERGQRLRLIRDGVVHYEGKNSSLRRFKDDVKEVPSGYECGIGIENYNDIKVGDILECYYLEEIKPEIE